MSVLGILPFTQTLMQNTVNKGDTVVDATMGNGHDTLFLARLVGARGTVLAYDIQSQALKRTRERLQQENELQQVHLYQKGHQTMEDELQSLRHSRSDKDAFIAGAMFNLGYLPHGDKQIVTRPTTTIKALHVLRHYIKQGGLVTVVIYSGHEQGKHEKDALLAEVSTWDQQHYRVLQYQFINQENDPPFLVAIQKI